MKKSELGVGMFVKLRNDKVCLINYNEDLINVSNGETEDDLFTYNEDLENLLNSDYDIVEVYSSIESFKKVWIRDENN